MTCTDVTTQTELDAALSGATGDTCIHIKSGAGVWLKLSAYDSATVEAYVTLSWPTRSTATGSSASASACLKPPSTRSTRG